VFKRWTMGLKSVTVDDLESMMRISEDVKKAYVYDKSTGKWFWVDRDDRDVFESWQGPFDSFFLALSDATEPYWSS
jgi:hypothetical protein